MDELLAAMAKGLRDMLAEAFEVDVARIEVRATLVTAGDLSSIRVEVDLDGKTPPVEWQALVSEFFRGIAGKIPGVVGIRSGTTEGGEVPRG